ncbi:CHAT domain-containing protein [Kribbella sp. NPDC058693]|uniref:CHAT domain-containing protein n=1 Tax=Kribbella sp. NPDC058693 TaxID=3346602 RepID=UPI0036638197
MRDLDSAVGHLQTVLRLLPPAHPEYATVQGNLGMMVAARQTGESTREAIALWRAALARTPAGDPGRAFLTGQLGQGSYELFQYEGDPALLDKSIVNLSEAVRSLPESESAVLRVNLAVTLLTRHNLVRPDRAELDRAIDILESLLAASFESSAPDLPGTARIYLTQALSARFTDYRDPADLARIRQLQRAAKPDPASSPAPNRMSFIDHDVRATEALYGYLGDARQSDVDRAVEEQEAALASSDKAAIHRVPLILNLAATLSVRHHARRIDLTSFDSSADLVRAIDLVEEALTGEVPAIWRGVALAQLGALLLERHLADPAARSADLPAATKALHSALTDGLLDRQSRIGAQSRLSYCELAAARTTGDPALFDRAVSGFREVVAVVPDSSPLRAGVQGTLADALFARAESTRRPDHLGEAIDIAREVLAAEQTDRAAVFLAARSWGESAWRRGAFSEAAEAYGAAVAQLHDISALQTERDHKALPLRQAEGLAARAAYAYVVTNDPASAAVVLETGRALMLSEVLQREHPDLARLQQSEHRATATRFRELADAVAAAERALLFATAGGQPAEREGYRNTLDQLRQATLDVRGIPGFEHFLTQPRFADLTQTATRCGSPLVYLAATDRGGLGLIVHPAAADESVDIVPLPTLTSEFEREAIELLRKGTAETDDLDVVEALMEELSLQLWDSVMAPVVQLMTAAKAVLIPTGRTGLLPLHAAGRPDPAAATGIRYVADDLVTVYAPSARALTLVAGRPDAEDGAIRKLLAVHELQAADPADRLEATATEIALVSATVGSPRITEIRGSEASRAELLRALPQYDVCHFACHAGMFLSDPLSGGLVLSDDEVLSVRDLLSLPPFSARLAVLSACDTARIDEHLPDEVVSLATGFYQVGFAAVIATSWPAEDGPAAAQMALTYRFWLTDGNPLPTALTLAARWLRDSTNGEKQLLFPDLFAPPTAAESDPDWAAQRDHGSPLVWAAFTHTGL